MHLDGANFRRSILAEERMGDPDRAARAPGLDRRQARGAVSRRADVAAGGGPIRFPQASEKRRGKK